MRLSVFAGEITSPESKLQLRQVEADLHDQTVLAHMPVDWTEVFRHAEKLGAAHNERLGCRSVDLFHVATAATLRARNFLTFDAKQATLAKRTGLTVYP